MSGPRSPRVLALTLALSAAACASSGPAPAPAAVSAADARAMALVSGTVTYRERLALPADATVDVWIVDTSPGIGTMAVLAEASVAAQGRQVPLSFALRVDPARVQQRRSYGLKAAIAAGGQRLFETREPVPVLTLGHPSLLVLTLTRVTAAPGPAR